MFSILKQMDAKDTKYESKMCVIMQQRLFVLKCDLVSSFTIYFISLVEVQTCTDTEKKVQVTRRPDWNGNIFSFAQRDYISSTLSLLYFSPGLGCLHWRKEA